MLEVANPQHLEVLTVSAFRAHGFAQGQEEPNWEFLDLETQGRWERLCRRSEAILSANEGCTYAEAAQRVYEAFHLGSPTLPFQDLSKFQQMAWQAVARHLMALIDGDEISDLDTLERSWRGWVQERVEKSS